MEISKGLSCCGVTLLPAKLPVGTRGKGQPLMPLSQEMKPTQLLQANVINRASKRKGLSSQYLTSISKEHAKGTVDLCIFK